MRSAASGHRGARLLGVCLTGALVLGACAEPDPEVALERASEELEGAREALEIADGEVQAIRARMRALEEDLADAERVRREAQRHVTEAEALLGERASDDVLFRSVQRRLLEDEALADAAVTAHVASRVVTLRGHVGSTRLRDRAIEVASGAPGVARVISELEVPSTSPSPEEME
jgi:osmotically-inducible protein OsmY